MGMLKAMHVLMLSLLIAIGVLVVIPVADAGCCMCDQACGSRCTCPGTYPCAACVIDNDATNAAFDSPLIRNVPHVAINSHAIDRLIRHVGAGQCDRNNSRIKITDQDYMLKVDTIYGSEYADQTQIVALQTSRDGGK